MRFVRLEAIFWIAALIAPIFIDPHGGSHFTFCLPSHLGIDSCPGCGLGRALALLYRGEFVASLDMHILGVPTVAALVWRICVLMKSSILQYSTVKGGLSGGNL